jgi:shikimate kinase
LRCYNSLVSAKNNIYLVGMPGAGKTTVGRQLARRLQRSFVDADHEIEARTGVRIPLIFDIEGELGFRERESKVIAELADETNLIVATGGGLGGFARERGGFLLDVKRWLLTHENSLPG